MGGFKVNTSNTESKPMGVKLKQRTYENKDGRACEEKDPNAAFLVGPNGATISDDKAVSLGLTDGRLAGTGKEDIPVDKKAEDGRKVSISVVMLEMVDEVRKDKTQKSKLFTKQGLPDCQVINSRAKLDPKVTNGERDKVWVSIPQGDKTIKPSEVTGG